MVPLKQEVRKQEENPEVSRRPFPWRIVADLMLLENVGCGHVILHLQQSTDSCQLETAVFRNVGVGVRGLRSWEKRMCGTGAWGLGPQAWGPRDLDPGGVEPRVMGLGPEGLLIPRWVLEPWNRGHNSGFLVSLHIS